MSLPQRESVSMIIFLGLIAVFLLLQVLGGKTENDRASGTVALILTIVLMLIAYFGKGY